MFYIWARKPGVEPFEAAVNIAEQMGWTEFDPALSWVHVGVRTWKHTIQTKFS